MFDTSMWDTNNVTSSPFPTIGEIGNLYIETSDEKLYLWDADIDVYVKVGDSTFESRLTILEDSYGIKEIWESISASSGTITQIYSNTTINQDKWLEGVYNAYVVKIETGRPKDELAVDSSGNIIFVTSLNASGDFVLSGTPNSFPVAIIWQVKGKAKDLALIPESVIVDEFEIETPVVRDGNGDIKALNSNDNWNFQGGGLKDNNATIAVLLADATNTEFNTTNKTIIGAVNELEQIRDITKEPTGFTVPEDVIVTGDGSARTITLTGTVNAYYKGELNTTIINSWTSDPHTNDTNIYYLIYDGSSIQWVSPAGFKFNYLQIAFTFYANGTNERVYSRECHGVQPWQSHIIIHDTIGTYRQAGGDLGDYVLSSTTVSERRPSISATYIIDEDLLTINPLLASEGNYTQHWLDGAGADSTFATTPVDIIPLLTNRPYWNEFTGGAWQQTLMSNNYHTSIWVLNIPVGADLTSQKYRYLFIQGQSQSLSVSGQQNLNLADLNLGDLEEFAPEFVFSKQIIIKYTAANWVIVEVVDLTGTRIQQVGSPAGNFLTAVTTDTTLTGNGTVSTPLGIDLTNANTWTGGQIFKAHTGFGSSGVIKADDIQYISEAFIGHTSGVKTGINIFTVAYPGAGSSADYIGISTLTNTDAAPNGTTGKIVGSQAVVIHSANLGTTVSELMGSINTCSLGGILAESDDVVGNMYGFKASSFANSSNTGTVATNAYGIDVASHQSGKGTVANLYGGNFTTSITDVSGNITNAYGIKTSHNHVAGTIENAYGIWVGNVAGADTNNYGIVLDGDDLGSGIIFGDDQDASIHFDGTDLIISPGGDLNVQGSGKVGINQVSPTYKLDINSGGDNEVMRIQSTDVGSYIRYTDNNATEYFVGASGGTWGIWSQNGGVNNRFLIGTNGEVTLPAVYLDTVSTSPKILSIQSDGQIGESTTATPTFGNLTISGLTASQIVETDGSKLLISASKGTAYNKAFGSGSGDVCEGDDSRLSDSRTPTAHDLSGALHNSSTLANLNLKISDADVPNDNAVVHLSGDETVGGIKTFTSFSITPSSAPTTDYQVANKKYVDDNITVGYLKADGTIPLTANWDAGSFKITAETLESDVAIGTAPLVITSTTKVSNLNVDQVDGYDFDQSLQITDDVIFNDIFATGSNVGLGNIEGLVIKYNAGASIKIKTGWAEANGKFYNLASDTTHLLLNLVTAFEFWYIYIDDSASTPPTPTFIDSTTAPTWSDSKRGWYNGNDRCIGVVICPSGSLSIAYFSDNGATGKLIEYHLGSLAMPRMASLMNPTGSWQTPDDNDGSVVTPVNATRIKLYLGNSDTATAVWIYATSAEMATVNTSISDGDIISGAYQHLFFNGWVNLGTSRNIKITGSDNDENGLNCDCTGWAISR